MFDYHVHLHRGPYALDWLDRFLDTARQVGVTELGIAEHFHFFRESFPILDNEFVRRHTERRLNGPGGYLAFIEEVRSRGLPVKAGLEVDYVPEKELETAQAIRGLPIDFVIGSVHWIGDWGFDLDPRSWEGRSVAESYDRYYTILARAAESGLFDILGHPGSIGYFGHRPPAPLLEEFEERFFERVSGLGLCLEINSGGFRRPCRHLFPREETLSEVRRTGLPIVVSSDAHGPEEVGYGFTRVRALLRNAGFAETSRFTNRQRTLATL